VTTADEVTTAVRRGPSDEWVARVARLGLAARGVIYGVVGVLALQIVFGRDRTDEAASKDGALQAIAERSLGRLLLIGLACGLAGYLAWRASEALWGRRDEDDDDQPAAVVKRIGSAGKALVYVALLASTLRLIASPDSGSGSGDEQPRALTARALELPAGRWIVGAVGVALLGFAVHVAVRGISQRFEERLDTSELGRVTGALVDLVGTLGMVARGMVAGVLGLLVVKAAVDFDPQEARGIDGTLQVLAQQRYGQVLLTATAVGLLAFALYCLAEARYREV
jgi:hypothetical protein